MSTKAQIIVLDGSTEDGIGCSAVLYKHGDGGPAAVLPSLVKTVRAFRRARGYDPEYLTAQILWGFAVDAHLKWMREAWSSNAMVPSPRSFRGWGIVAYITDAEYTYIVKPDGTIEVWQSETGEAQTLRELRAESQLLNDVPMDDPHDGEWWGTAIEGGFVR